MSASYYSERTAQALAKTSSSARKLLLFRHVYTIQHLDRHHQNSLRCVGTKRPPQTNTPNNGGSSSARAIQQVPMMESQGPREDQYNKYFTLGETSTSDIVRARITTCKACSILMDVHWLNVLNDPQMLSTLHSTSQNVCSFFYAFIFVSWSTNIDRANAKSLSLDMLSPVGVSVFPGTHYCSLRQ